MFAFRPSQDSSPGLTNPDFERGDLAAWLVLGGDCVTVIDDAESAHEGRYYAQIDTSGDGCTSLSYDFRLPFAVGETIRFATYVQSAEPQLKKLETVFWTGHHPLERNGVDLDLKQGRTHFVQADQWRCLEITYEIATAEYDVVRAAFHWPKDEATHLLLDAAQVGFGDQFTPSTMYRSQRATSRSVRHRTCYSMQILKRAKVLSAGLKIQKGSVFQRLPVIQL